MILGTECTRNCGFCGVTHGLSGGIPDPSEPERLIRAVRETGLSFVVVTSVTRDDLADGGASHFAAVIRGLRDIDPRPGIEVLIPDFGGNAAALDLVLEAGPDVLAHNIETVPRLYPKVRPGASYEGSLGIIRRASEGGTMTKSGIMLGLGETRDDIERTIHDIRDAGAEIFTIGQYLRPSREALVVERFVPPEEFDEIGSFARVLGFRTVLSGPLVRSSLSSGAAAGWGS